LARVISMVRLLQVTGKFAQAAKTFKHGSTKDAEEKDL